MIERIRERIVTAINRIENRHTEYLFPPILYGRDRPADLKFFMFDEQKLIIDQNLYPSGPQYYPVSMVAPGVCHAHTYPDGMLVLFPSHCTIPMPNSYLPHSELNVPIMLIAHIDPHKLWDEAIATETKISFSLHEAQSEPIILLRNLFYRRPEMELISVDQIQLLYTNVLSGYSHCGPVKTTFDPGLVGIRQTTDRTYVPAFGWNMFRDVGETMLNFARIGDNGLHTWLIDAKSAGEIAQFIDWIARIDIRTDRPGWFADPEDEMRALTMLGRL